MKSNAEFENFNKAMETTLKAKPAVAKAQMEAEKKDRVDSGGSC